ESKLSLNAAKAEDHEFDLSLITSSKDKKNNIYLCIKGSFRKEESLVAFDTFTFAVLNIATKYKCIFEK
ncbi:hypothetical protein ACMSEF_27790, partial [Bacteroides thetaiotaomicron]|uniref:hypothetical protein n=1 Tax=Bacteroides thetaiotaomicron TaxID=818 RepID=UPI0039C2B2E6